MPVRVTRYHDISCGHRVVGHESKCRHFHGHNYRTHFTCEAEALDDVGRVIDFGVIKDRLCNWIEENWDHKMLLWSKDPVLAPLAAHDVKERIDNRLLSVLCDSVVAVPFNPTAENMALHLLNEVGPAALEGTGVRLVSVSIDETAKCSASAEL